MNNNEKTYIELMKVNRAIERFDTTVFCDCEDCNTIRKALQVYRNYLIVFEDNDSERITALLEGKA